MRFLLVLALLASFPASARTAFWLRPPATAAQLEQTLVAARAAGFTDVLLEGFYHGRTIWPSAVAPMKTNYDALKTALDVGARANLNVSVWMETLYWRPAARFDVPVTTLWQDGWATRTAGGQESLDVSDLGFVDPAERGVGDVLEGIVREIAARYPAAGLHLDYLRLPREADFGFSPASLAEFERRTGKDARAISKVDAEGTPTPEWRVWTEVRRNAITNLANRLIGAYKAGGGRGLISAAVYRGFDEVQDWRAWRGLDAAMPMLYLPWSALYPPALLGWPKGGNVWPGVQVGPGYPPLAEQLALVRGQGFQHVAVFGWTP